VGGSLGPLRRPHLQAFLSIQPVSPLGIYGSTFPPQQHRQTPVPIAHPAARHSRNRIRSSAWFSAGSDTDSASARSPSGRTPVSRSPRMPFQGRSATNHGISNTEVTLSGGRKGAIGDQSC